MRSRQKWLKIALVSARLIRAKGRWPLRLIYMFWRIRPSRELHREYFFRHPGGTTTIMKRNKIVFALSTVLFALGSLAARPQTVGAPVEGTVSREGQPLADVQVIFNN